MLAYVMSGMLAMLSSTIVLDVDHRAVGQRLSNGIALPQVARGVLGVLRNAVGGGFHEGEILAVRHLEFINIESIHIDVMSGVFVTTAVAIALPAAPAIANDRYAEPPPLVVSPDLSAPWVLQLRRGPVTVVFLPVGFLAISRQHP